MVLVEMNAHLETRISDTSGASIALWVNLNDYSFILILACKTCFTDQCTACLFIEEGGLCGRKGVWYSPNAKIICPIQVLF